MKAQIQSFGRFLSSMVMPNIGAFIAWGLITALFIKVGWINLIAGGTLLLDQGSKALARSVLRQDARLPLLGDLLGLQLIFNPGTILSLGSGATWVFTVVGVVAVVVLGRLAARARSNPPRA